MDVFKIPTDFGRRLRTVVKSRGYTQRQLSRHLDVSEQAVSRYIRGDRMPNSRVLMQLAISLDVSADYLLGLKENI